MRIDAEKCVLLVQETRDYNRARANEANAAGVPSRDSRLIAGVLDRILECAEKSGPILPLDTELHRMA